MSSDMKLMEDRILASLRETNASIVESEKTILLSISAVTERFDALESKVADISTRQSLLDSKVRTLNARVEDSTAQVAQDCDEKIRELKEQVQEERRKLIRLSNVVLFGVAETKEGLEIATRLISVLLPDWKGQIEDDRIGSADSSKPRPLRIKLDNYQQKRKALSSKRKLAKFPEFEGISVQPDMTKTEQKMSKERSNTKKSSQKSRSKSTQQPTSSGAMQPGSSKSGVETRADRKRRCSSDLNVSQSSKFGKGNDSIDID
jgi:hypothetical protein